MIKIARNCNVHIQFENGVTVSILIGGGSYSENYDNMDLIGHEREKVQIKSSTAEVAMWDKSGNMEIINKYTEGSNNVLGWQTPDQILDLLNWARNYKQ